MTKEILAVLGTPPSPLYNRTEKIVRDIDQKLTQLIHKWRFFKAGPPMRVKKFDGSEICYQGIRYSGSPVQVFWSDFIDPYLENYSAKVLEQTSALAIECQFSVEESVEEAKNLLLVMIRRIYAEMAETDQILRGDGIQFPDKEDVSGYIERMSNFVLENSKIEKMKRPVSSKQIFNIESISGTNLQIGSNNSINDSGIKKYFRDIALSGDRDAILLLRELLNNNIARSFICPKEYEYLMSELNRE